MNKNALMRFLAGMTLRYKWYENKNFLYSSCPFCHYANEIGETCMVTQLLCNSCKLGEYKSLFGKIADKLFKKGIIGADTTVGDTKAIPEGLLMITALHDLNIYGELQEDTIKRIEEI